MANLISLYNKIAGEYDKNGKRGSWYSPQVLFGLHFPFVNPKDKLLDMGIGTGLSSKPYHKLGLEIYGVDASKGMIEVCKEKELTKNLQVFDLKNIGQKQLPYPNNYFNHIVSNGVLCFLRDLDLVFKEVERVLMNRGTFAFTVESSEKEDVSSRLITVEEAWGSTNLDSKIEFPIFSHGRKYIEKLAKSQGFCFLINPLKFHAYYSPSEEKNVYFDAYILKR